MKSSASMSSLLGAHKDSGELKVTVFGSGSFGMAMATLVARNGFDVVVLTRREEVAEGINTEHRNPTHLKDFKLPENLTATTDADVALSGTSFIVHCIPLQSTKEYLERMKDKIGDGVPIVSTSKGLHTETLEMMHEIIPNALGRKDHPVAFLSGPTFAQDIMTNTPSGAVLASGDILMSRKVRKQGRKPIARADEGSNPIARAEEGRKPIARADAVANPIARADAVTTDPPTTDPPTALRPSSFFCCWW